MKKLIALLLALILVFSFAACKKAAPTATPDAQISANTDAESSTEEQKGEEPVSPFDPDTEIALPIILEDGTMLNPDGTPMEPADEEPVEDETPAQPETNTAVVILQAIWGLYGDEEKFSIIGGNMEANIMDTPGVWDLAYKDGLTTSLLIPAEQLASVTEAASMIHMMNTNTFTCGVVKLAEGTDTAAFAQAVRDAIQGNQWMCGFPEKLIVADVGNGCMLVSFGVNDTMNVFESKLTVACAEAQILFNEAITG